jgi:hypothetical protein
LHGGEALSSLGLIKGQLIVFSTLGRYQALTQELKVLETMLEQLTLKYAKRLRQRFGVGP